MPQFDEQELDSISDESFNKILDSLSRYRARIEAQCEINEAHDELHK